MSSKKGKRAPRRLKNIIPIGSLVQIIILDRINELGIIIEANYGLEKNSWYFVYGFKSGKQYYAFPNEVIWIKIL